MFALLSTSIFGYGRLQKLLKSVRFETVKSLIQTATFLWTTAKLQFSIFAK